MTVDKSVETLNPSTVWAEIIGSIRAEVSADTFDRWFKETELVALNDETLTLRVPNNIYQLWIESNYLQSACSLRRCSRSGVPRAVQFTYGGQRVRASERARRAREPPANRKRRRRKRAELHARSPSRTG